MIASEDRILKKEVKVEVPLEKAWKLWTTKSGLASFFAKECNFDLRVGGPFEMFFLLDDEPGMRGSEGCQIQAIESQKMLSYTWNAPPHLPTVRSQRTLVVLRFDELGPKETLVRLFQYGWGIGDEWTQAYHYFDQAWGRVLNNFKTTIES